jgi:aryl carrier-like protein
MIITDASLGASSDLPKQKAFWTRMLHGVAAPTKLHVNTGRGLKDKPAGMRSHADASSYDALGIPVQQLYACCAAAVLLLASRYTADTDLLIGVVPASCQSDTPPDSCVCPMRYSVASTDSLGQVREAVASLMMEMFRNRQARPNTPQPGIVLLLADTLGAAPPPPRLGGIAFAVHVAEGRFSISSSFDPLHYDADGVAQIENAIARLAQTMVLGPNVTISGSLDLAGFDESAPPRCYLRNGATGTITALLAERVHSNPRATAARHGGESLEYISLERQSSSLARLLAENGVVPGTPVGLMVRPGLQEPIAIVGILKSRGICVPLHPSTGWPPGYSEIRKVLVVSARDWAEQADFLRTCGPWHRIICLDQQVERESREPAWAEPDPGDIAFWCPGPASHGTLVRQALLETEPLGPTVQCSVMRDAATLGAGNLWRIIAPLITGGSVLYCDEPNDPLQLLTAIQHGQLSVVEVSPAILASLLALQSGPLGSLCLMVVSGEPAPFPLLDAWMAANPHVALVPALRAGGATFRSAIWRRADAEQMLSPTFPDASPISIRNRAGEPVPNGVPGEIWYLPDFPAAQTVPVWTRTGQWGKKLGGGGIEWFGRSFDGESGQQLVERIRLQALLSARSPARFCALTALPDKTSGPTMVAYVPGREEISLPESDAIVPLTIRRVEDFHLLPDGSVDFAALDNPSEQDPSPRSPVDEALAGLWSEILKAPTVGIHDDFFALGGNSILAMQLTARIRRIFHRDISLRAVFDTPSVAALSDILMSMEKEAGQSARMASLWLRTRVMSTAEIEELLRKSRATGIDASQ